MKNEFNGTNPGMKKNTLVLLFLLSAGGAHAELRVAKVFTDGAVFQRQKPVPVWGWTVHWKNRDGFFPRQSGSGDRQW
jgi:hypothetical protein